MTWTKQPPKELGFYWYRDDRNGLSVVEGPDERGCWMLIGDDRMVGHADLLAQTGEWWDQRIPAPRSAGTKFYCPYCRDKWDIDYEGSLYSGLELTCPFCKSVSQVTYKLIKEGREPGYE